MVDCYAYLTILKEKRLDTKISHNYKGKIKHLAMQHNNHLQLEATDDLRYLHFSSEAISTNVQKHTTHLSHLQNYAKIKNGIIMSKAGMYTASQETSLGLYTLTKKLLMTWHRFWLQTNYAQRCQCFCPTMLTQQSLGRRSSNSANIEAMIITRFKRESNTNCQRKTSVASDHAARITCWLVFKIKQTMQIFINWVGTGPQWCKLLNQNFCC